MNDEIVAQVRQTRRAFAARFNYDVRAMGKFLKAQQRRQKNNIVIGRVKKSVPIKKRYTAARKAA
ncbi:hypothetical protein FBQ82_02800 [Anaerolineae bacterium CFX7]|nr:hypothetical protein [Anaerolineae bacterium CFX7]